MAVSSPARSSGTWGQTGLPANFRQKAPEIHGSLVSPPTATRSVTRVDVRIAGSRLPVAVSVIVAATGARIVAPAEGDAYADAKVWAGPEASTVVIASAGVEPAGVVTASRAEGDASPAEKGDPSPDGVGPPSAAGGGYYSGAEGDAYADAKVWAGPEAST